jgi:hypothetical protein
LSNLEIIDETTQGLNIEDDEDDYEDDYDVDDRPLFLSDIERVLIEMVREGTGRIEITLQGGLRKFTRYVNGLNGRPSHLWDNPLTSSVVSTRASNGELVFEQVLTIDEERLEQAIEYYSHPHRGAGGGIERAIRRAIPGIPDPADNNQDEVTAE